MPPSTRELILRFTGDSRQLRQTMAALSADLSRFSQGQVTIAQGVVRQTHASEQRRIADTVRAANQRLREEQRAGREVARIMAETARQADRQERLRERAAKQVADVQIREARRAARELERSLATGRRGSPIAGSSALDITGQLGSITSSIPIVGRLTSQFSTLTAEAGAAGTAIGAVAGPIALMVAGIGTGIAALFALGKAFFDVVTATAEFQGKFRDLSQQVGVSAESLSTLDFFAETTGGNIETVSASLAIFQKNLEAAHDPTSKEAKLLKELGVTSLDTETALRQTIRGLSNLGEGSKQTTSALELFGRSGRFVNAIVKESEGDFDKAGEAAAKYGRLVTTEAAIAADKFNDSLIILKGQIAGVTRSLTQDSIPVFIAFFDQISAGLAKNAKDWQGWSFEIAQFTAFTLANLKTLAQFASSGLTIPILSFNALVQKNFDELMKGAQRVRNEIQFQADVENIQRLSASLLAGRPGDRPDAKKKSASEAQARANKDIQLQQQALEEATRRHRESLERERDLDLKSIKDWEQESFNLAGSHLAAQQKIFRQEKRDAQESIKNRQELSLALREIKQKDEKAQNEFFSTVRKVQDEAAQRRSDAELKLNQELLTIRDAQRDAELQRIRVQQERLEITESHALQRQIALLKQAFADRDVLRQLELEQATTTATRLQSITNERIADEIRLTSETKRLTGERIRALQEEGAKLTPKPNEGRQVKDKVPKNPVDIKSLGPPPAELETLIDVAIKAAGAFAGLGVAISNTFRTGAEGAIAIADTLTTAFGAMADAVGQAVHAFVLFGEVKGGFRRFAAEVIASVAQMAIVKAVFEAAEGLAMLALSWFTGNPKYGASAGAHFAAAAMYGTIGGVAAIAGRALAGNRFNQSGAGGGGGSGGTELDGSSAQLNPLTFGRNQPLAPQRQIVEHRHTIRVEVNDSEFGRAISARVVKDYRQGGPIREVIINDD